MAEALQTIVKNPPSSSKLSSSANPNTTEGRAQQVSQVVLSTTVPIWEARRQARRSNPNYRNLADDWKLKSSSSSAPLSQPPTGTEMPAASAPPSSSPPQNPPIDEDALRLELSSLPLEEQKEIKEAAKPLITAALDQHNQDGAFQSDGEEGSKATPPKTPTKIVQKADRALERLFTPPKGLSTPSSGRSTPFSAAKRLDFDSPPAKKDSKDSNASTQSPPVKGPNRIAIILATFTGVSFFAYTMAYGLPSFGKIKGWPGATAP